jgi:hypothetical protein
MPAIPAERLEKISSLHTFGVRPALLTGIADDFDRRFAPRTLRQPPRAIVHQHA